MLLSVNFYALVLFLVTAALHHQSTPYVFYVESWKRGTGRVQEQKLCVRLSAARPEYETSIRDASGEVRYRLSVWPGRASESNSDIIEWSVELIEIAQGNDVNLLTPSNDPQQDYFNAQDRIWWLYPVGNPQSIAAETDVVPFLARRVVKVENFYCIIQVKDYRFRQGEIGVFDSITIEVEFTNSYDGPRTNPSAMNR